MKNNRLYVGNLSWDSTEASLREAFSSFGEVVDIKLITDRETGRSRGFGFVTMDSDESAEQAIEGMNGSVVDGRPLRVNVAEERRPRGGGGGGGGGRGGDRGGRGGDRGDRGGRGGGGGRW